jgi:Histidine kinase-, DNA gyrase B-, and HSP90-like ATPase
VTNSWNGWSVSMQPSEYSLKPDLLRRVENYSLAPSVPSNSLVPIYEAIYNSLHALQEKFGRDDWYDSGFVEIIKYRTSMNELSFSIRDNGVGLTEENFDSFLTYDSALKKKIGGKGIGRLSWLKAFQKVEVESIFLSGSARLKRTFEFHLDNDAPIQDCSSLSVIFSGRPNCANCLCR